MNVYEIITERITELLEKGEIPWRQTWANGKMPQNLVTKKAYRGLNVWMLASAHRPNPYWLTYKQAKELGGSVKAGEKALPVIFWKFEEYEKEKADGTKKMETFPIVRYYRVFNLDQCENINPKRIPNPDDERAGAAEIPSCEAIVDAMPNAPQVFHDQDRAFYSMTGDYVNVPDRKLFKDDPAYYGALFHELTHSTGHESRLGRHPKDGNARHHFGDPSYAREELVAEMGSAFLLGTADMVLPDVENATAYIQSWLQALKNDKRLVIVAGGQAQKAADYILGRTRAN